MKDAPARLSPLAEAIAARGRRGATHDCSRFLGLGGKPMGPAFIQVPVVGEEIEAVEAAHVVAGKATIEAARKDPDLLDNAKGVEIVWRAFREDGDRKYPLFPSPGWMRENLTSDETGALLNMLLEVRREHGPDPSVINEATVEIIAEACAGSKDATEILAGFAREQLTSAFTLLAIMWAHRGVRLNAIKAGMPDPADPLPATVGEDGGG